MKKSLLLFSLVMSGVAFGQGTVDLPQIDAQMPKVLRYHQLAQNKSQACAVDTLYYTDAKASNQSTKVAFTTGSTSTGFVISYSQWFKGSTNLSVSGFKWFGKSNDPNLTSNPSISVVCEMYAAGIDGLPTGAPLASETVVVDTNSSNIEHDVVFSTPVVTSSDYVMVVTNNQADQLFVMSNDEQSNDGAGESLCGVYYEPLGMWRKSFDLFGFGDFDMLFYPFVEYTIDASFSPPASGCQNVASSFSNTSSNHFTNKFLNVDVFNGNSKQHDWDYGDGNTSDNVTTGSNAYAAAGTYNITLTSTINGWTMNCTDSEMNSFLVHPTPIAPTSTPPAPVCEYTTIGDLTASGGASGNYNWYDDIGLSSQLGSGSPFSSGIQLPDTVYVTNIENGCESAGTEVILTFDPNPIPTFTMNNLGNNDIQFAGAPVATTYAWDFGDGNTDNVQVPTHTYTATSTYTVCLDVTYANSCQNQYCDNIAIVGVEENELGSQVKMYPNPVFDILHVDFSYFPENTQVVLYDMFGKKVLEQKAEMYYQLNVQNLRSGVYFIILEVEGTEVLRRKMVKK